MKIGTTRFTLLALAAAGLGIPAAVANAGDLDPPGPPAPTMKTLDEVPGSWHRKLDSTNGDVNGCNSDRFKCVMNDEAVLDVETGLVWQKTPAGFAGAQNFTNAELQCVQVATGGRNGWRLPTAPEILTLRDDSEVEYLPSGHPFVGIANGVFWASNSYETWNGSGFDPFAWAVAFRADVAGSSGPAMARATTFIDKFWCVRGPSSDPGPGH